MVTRKKFKRKIKINYKLKLRPFSLSNTPPHSKSSRIKTVIAGFIKKFKTPARYSQSRALKSRALKSRAPKSRAPRGVKRHV